MQLFEDRVHGGGPLEGLAVRVVRRDEVIDALHELFDTGALAPPRREGKAAAFVPVQLPGPNAPNAPDIYTTQVDDSVRVVNRGYAPAIGQWREAVGKALFTGAATTGSFKVSFFGPLYGGYHRQLASQATAMAALLKPSNLRGIRSVQIALH